uniref:Uncharacterized protein n=1 Tax=Compsopogon caeruleus TaxID=31354 RepID=A0A6T6AR05_9RHOD|mmetsp:Transcript_11689/g.23794  ORF Transcript_11689/g.23794 Transcript_11689/m.23794 type:complete len:641 (+) Transcript_11689:351-2273(+)
MSRQGDGWNDAGCGPDSAGLGDPFGRLGRALMNGPRDVHGLDPGLMDAAGMEEQRLIHEDIQAQLRFGGPPLPPGQGIVPRFLPGLPSPEALAAEFEAQWDDARQGHLLPPMGGGGMARLGPHGELVGPFGAGFDLDRQLPRPFINHFDWERGMEEAFRPPVGLPPPTLIPQPHPAPVSHTPMPRDVDHLRQRAREVALRHFDGENEQFIEDQVNEFMSSFNPNEMAGGVLDDEVLRSMQDMSIGQGELKQDHVAQDTDAEHNNLADEFLTQEWATEFGNTDFSWAEEFRQQERTWAEEFAEEEDSYEADLREYLGHDSGEGDYEFDEDNPYLGNPEAMNYALRFLKEGDLAEAILALEAVVKAEPRNAVAWHLLGRTQAECDQDFKAIQALRRCVSSSEGLPEVDEESRRHISDALLELGVSYTNELNQSRALGYLRQWLEQHPRYGHLAKDSRTGRDNPDALRGSELAHADLLARFLAAREENPQDAEPHVVLGVLHNLSRDFSSAVAAFREALELLPEDYKLWNKLGATFANSSNASEALRSYRRAIELQPSFVRAWVNVGTAYANQAAYTQAARYYIRSLTLNRRATHLWNYLRTTVIAMNRDDLLPYIDQRDITSIESLLSNATTQTEEQTPTTL